MFTATHLHAMVIHFPIALVLIGYIFEIISLFSKNIFYRQSSFALLFIGTIGVLFAYFTGNAAGDGMEDGTMFRAMKLHEQSATFTLCIACSTAIYYSIYTNGNCNFKNRIFRWTISIQTWCWCTIGNA